MDAGFQRMAAWLLGLALAGLVAFLLVGKVVSFSNDKAAQLDSPWLESHKAPH